ncbi:Hypothetical protein, putative [Bodo saltans]|uniref:Uncharacterized protein n=1 Tax=Bodo saltans TaxID=75058 RepID=A0A0S4JG71_BODSA|nr:Hypothetical protein, putative [Bodo saltans]|eukprot:CUG87976.1 Hypothetical protein, putative [Bodo saltans]
MVALSQRTKRIRFIVDGNLVIPGSEDATTSPTTAVALSPSSPTPFFVPCTVPCSIVRLSQFTNTSSCVPLHEQLVEQAMDSFSQSRHMLHCHGSVGLDALPWELCVVQQGLPVNAASWWSLPAASSGKKQLQLSRTLQRCQATAPVIRFPMCSSSSPVAIVSLLRRHTQSILDARRRSTTSCSSIGKRRIGSMSLTDVYLDKVEAAESTSSVEASFDGFQVTEEGTVDPQQDLLQNIITTCDDVDTVEAVADNNNNNSNNKQFGDFAPADTSPQQPHFLAIDWVAVSAVDDISELRESSKFWVKRIPTLNSNDDEGQDQPPDYNSKPQLSCSPPSASEVECTALPELFLHHFSVTDIEEEQQEAIVESDIDDHPCGTLSEESFLFEFLCVWDTLSK